ncbi:Putative NADP-dependent oxidoreductase YfmJ [Paraburkholderia sediminicola]|uniref:NADP-dependent oxidoreductase YfmJ n=1 Tax=Paraburkholderia sediminicola TaxID=458836 RepID=A0A6J5A9T2_9BURK|nr:NADP-dependent oxidoreductase [Paraburkholderia sediminicola]CAB3659928.1 Putative NADP-dependent oxidoreductase YfmJ [Paraburkholderia sediminicola]
MTAIPDTCREIRLKVRPDGLPGAENFEIVSIPLPIPADDEVLVRNCYFLVSASLRMMISKGAEDVEGVPFPALREGDALAGEALGEIVSAPANSGFSPGDLVLHFQGWREYATVPIAQCRPVEPGLPDPVGYLGHGWTAYAALTRGVQIRPGDTVFVSSAAGAIGSMAGQIARLLGAKRVIGSTSSKEKAARLVSELGYDAAVFRGAAPIVEQLAAAAPQGIDVIIDNVGGEQLQAAIANARVGARVVILGALSGQLVAEGPGRIAPVELDSMQLLLKKITLRGYSADDDPHMHAEWISRFADWLDAGSIRFPREIITGLECAPQALARVINGECFGTVVVRL